MKGGEVATQWQAPASFGWVFHYAWDKDALGRALRGLEKSWILTTLLPPKPWVYIIILEKEILTISALLIKSKPTNNSPPSGWTELGTSKPVSFSGGEGPSERHVPPDSSSDNQEVCAINLGQHSECKVLPFLLCLLASSESEFCRLSQDLQMPPVCWAPCEEGLVSVKMNWLWTLHSFPCHQGVRSSKQETPVDVNC